MMRTAYRVLAYLLALSVAVQASLIAFGAVFVPFLAASFVSLAVRYRTGSWLLRQQVKWLVLTAGAFLASMLLALLSTWAGQPGLNSVANAVSAVIPLFGIPAAIAVAILKHQL